jgi:hypothetical protein
VFKDGTVWKNNDEGARKNIPEGVTSGTITLIR